MAKHSGKLPDETDEIIIELTIPSSSLGLDESLELWNVSKFVSYHHINSRQRKTTSLLFLLLFQDYVRKDVIRIYCPSLGLVTGETQTSRDGFEGTQT